MDIRLATWFYFLIYYSMYVFKAQFKSFVVRMMPFHMRQYLVHVYIGAWPLSMMYSLTVLITPDTFLFQCNKIQTRTFVGAHTSVHFHTKRKSIGYEDVSDCLWLWCSPFFFRFWFFCSFTLFSGAKFIYVYHMLHLCSNCYKTLCCTFVFQLYVLLQVFRNVITHVYLRCLPVCHVYFANSRLGGLLVL